MQSDFELRLRRSLLDHCNTCLTRPQGILEILALLVLGFLITGPGVATAGGGPEAVFETEFAQLRVGTNGHTLSLIQRGNGHEWLARGSRPFLAIKRHEQLASPLSFTAQGELWTAEFPGNIRLQLRVTPHLHYIALEVTAVQGTDIEEVRLADLHVTCNQNTGSLSGTSWNQQFVVGLTGLSDRVNVQVPGNGLLSASLYPAFGFTRQGVALVLCPPERYLDIAQEIERDFGLPSPKLVGEWAKTSRLAQTSYLFVDLSETNANQIIQYAKLGGFGYVMIFARTWATSFGSYPVNTNNFPHGEAGLKATVDQLHAAGLKAGLHCLTSLVSKDDPLVRPRPDPRLLKDGEALLAADIDAHSDRIPVDRAMTAFQTPGASADNAPGRFGREIQIDDEIIRYREIGGPETNLILNLQRGFAGTIPARHKAGARVYQLVERAGCYLVDLHTSLGEEVSDRLAGVLNRCGFDMVYFDGAELTVANQPGWYWVSQPEDEVCRRVHRELRVHGSSYSTWTWHWLAQGTCDDFAAVAPKSYLDYHKIGGYWNFHHNNFMPAELGWWGLLAHAPDHPATKPDEVEFYATRMLALRSPVSLETHLGTMKQNGRTTEMLQLLGEYERLRLSDAIAPGLRERLRTGEWHLTRVGPTPAFAPIRYDAHRITLPREIQVTNTFEAQPLKFRLEILPGLSSVGSAANIQLLRSESGQLLEPPNKSSFLPGALSYGIVFNKPLDLTRHRGLAVRLRVKGSIDNSRPCPVLNVQLVCTAGTFRDYYLDLRSEGENTFVLPEPDTERLLKELRPVAYSVKTALQDFNYGSVMAVNFRWMRLPERQSPRCEVLSVEALRETPVSAGPPELSVGERTIKIPTEITPGDYVELADQGLIRVFNADGLQLSEFTHGANAPILDSGVNVVRIRAPNAPAARLTVITTGRPVPLDG